MTSSREGHSLLVRFMLSARNLVILTPKCFYFYVVQFYFSSFYGSNLWDLSSASAIRLCSSWNRMIGTTFNLPFATHRYILKELSERNPLQLTLSKRFSKFCSQIKNSGKPEVVNLFNRQKFDSRSIFGKNYRDIIYNLDCCEN